MEKSATFKKEILKHYNKITGSSHASVKAASKDTSGLFKKFKSKGYVPSTKELAENIPGEGWAKTRGRHREGIKAGLKDSQDYDQIQRSQEKIKTLRDEKLKQQFRRDADILDNEMGADILSFPSKEKGLKKAASEDRTMNKLAAAIHQLQESDGNYGSETLTIYKQACVATHLQEEYPRVASKIVNSFYKQASVTDDVATNAYKTAQGLCKLAGVELSEDFAHGLATVALINKEASCEENDKVCYKLIENMIKEAASRLSKEVTKQLFKTTPKKISNLKGSINAKSPEKAKKLYQQVIGNTRMKNPKARRAHGFRGLSDKRRPGANESIANNDKLRKKLGATPKEKESIATRVMTKMINAGGNKDLAKRNRLFHFNTGN